jgi:glycolate oxidase FAD binding subunit
LGVRIALADGRVIKAGGKVVKNVAGYDMTRLVAGSLGTLGVVTEVSLRLRPLPADLRTLLFAFPDMEGALATAEEQ